VQPTQKAMDAMDAEDSRRTMLERIGMGRLV